MESWWVTWNSTLWLSYEEVGVEGYDQRGAQECLKNTLSVVKVGYGCSFMVVT